MHDTLETCVLCEQLAESVERPGLAPICTDCLQSDEVQELLDSSVECFEEYRPGFAESALRFLWSWLFSAISLSMILTSMFLLINGMAIATGALPLRGHPVQELVRLFQGTLFFFGAGAAFVSVVALPMALIAVPLSTRQSIRYDRMSRSFVRTAGRRELVIPLESAIAAAPSRFFAGDGYSFYPPDRCRLYVADSSGRRAIFVCGHTDESIVKWRQLLVLLGVPITQSRPFPVIVATAVGGMAGLVVGLAFGALLTVVSNNENWILSLGMLGVLDGFCGALIHALRVHIAKHWNHQKGQALAACLTAGVLAMKIVVGFGGVGLFEALLIAVLNFTGCYWLIRATVSVRPSHIDD